MAFDYDTAFDYNNILVVDDDDDLNYDDIVDEADRKIT